MSETTTSTDATTETAATGETEVPLGEKGEKALHAEREARKAAEAAAKAAKAELDQIKQSQMSELEKAQAAAADALKGAEAARQEALRWRIAATHGISDEDAELYLTGGDEATLTRQAQGLAAKSAATSGTPKPDLTQAGTGQAPSLNGDGLEQALRDKLGIA